MKRYLALLLLVIMVVSVVSAAGVATAAPPKKLATPRLVAPRNRAVFSVNQLVTFQWTAVRGANVYYFLAIEKGTPDVLNPGTIKWVFNDHSKGPTTSYSRVYPAGAYRWQVTAGNNNDPSLNSAPSAWRYFTVR